LNIGSYFRHELDKVNLPSGEFLASFATIKHSTDHISDKIVIGGIEVETVPIISKLGRRGHYDNPQ